MAKIVTIAPRFSKPDGYRCSGSGPEGGTHCNCGSGIDEVAKPDRRFFGNASTHGVRYAADLPSWLEVWAAVNGDCDPDLVVLLENGGNDKGQ